MSGIVLLVPIVLPLAAGLAMFGIKKLEERRLRDRYVTAVLLVCAAAAAYIVLGLMGLPIFASGSSGVGYALQPSFGYILGFALGALLTGSIARGTPNPSWKRLLAANLAGMAVVYCLGTVYYYLITTVYLQESIGLWPLIVSCCLITAPKDIALCVLAAVLGKRLIPLVQTGKVA